MGCNGEGRCCRWDCRYYVGIEFLSVAGAAAKVAKEPGKSSEINDPRGNACFCKFADSKKDVSLCVMAEQKGRCCFFCLARLRSEMVIGQLSLLKVWSGGKGLLRSGNLDF